MQHTKPYILLADDDEDDQRFLQEIFTSRCETVGVVAFTDGYDVIEYLQACPDDQLPILILLDFKMPKMTAAATLQFLSTEPRYAAIPKMVWSTSNRPEYVLECMKWGATQYFLKPSSMDEFGHIVGQIEESLLSGGLSFGR